MVRGRRAKTPTDIPAMGWKDIALRVKKQMASDHVGLVAAGIAFYTLLAIFPALTAVLAIGGLVIDPSQIVTQLHTVTEILPQQASTIILDQARDVAGSGTGGLGLTAILGILLALYSASKGVSSLIEGMNVAYDEEEERSFIWLMVIRLGFTVALVVAAVLVLGIMMVIPSVLAFVDLGSAAEGAITGASWLLMLVVLVVALTALYRFGPDRDSPEWRWVTPGSLVACIVWLIATIGFAIYAANFGSYNESFGSLGGAIVLLMWLWVSAFIVLMGAELNAEIEAQTRHDTTTGENEPMGERGAQKADHLGEIS
ncbi:YihY/virulence factor BrkB family protein [Thioclava indica]|uniref:Uncharacterized protein n=1 Tax=Thioclava indica TaxID=1353528 RepID=A0A074KJI6_9RHOB|nr:YihY/virulence factor BrkB family protein [Thioclava indica]KEO61697.1 hypothetical protein DT23_01625 [Thioclava indica]